MMKVIGLSGYAGSGKTTAANYIQETYGIERRHIAAPLRSMLASLLSDNGLKPAEIHRYLEGDLKECVIPCLGVTSRHAQITLGTEWGREMINPDLWAKTWAAGIKVGSGAMNDSVRFPNEEAAIRKLAGFTIMIDRPGKGPAAFTGGRVRKAFGRWLYETFGIMSGVHPSERIDLLKPDFTIVNDGTIWDLYREIDLIMQFAGIRPIQNIQAA